MAVVDVLPLGSALERSYVVTLRGRLKLRVGSIVHVACSEDEAVRGFAFPKEERAALVASDPRFHLPAESEVRFHWVCATLAELDPREARELVVDAWRTVVPLRLARAYDEARPAQPGCGFGPTPGPELR